MPRDRAHQTPRYPLVICASLVAHPGNLGGLCRTVEAFCLESLVLANTQCTETWDFRGLAASAHHWQPTMICPPEQLPRWLQAQRQAGYSILALQARADAVPLTQFQFPNRAVLVLGRELTGIPGEILTHCDTAIAIPQYGKVESLNVQTAAAIAIYEYIRQQSQHPPVNF